MRLFNDYEGDVVGLWRALSEILNGFQEALLNRVTSRVGIPLNDLPQPFLSEHFVLRIFRVRKPIGRHDQNVSFVEMERAGFAGDEIPSPPGDMNVEYQLFNLFRSGAVQIAWIISCADELPCAIPA